jgi:signal transduction histidine kinase
MLSPTESYKDALQAWLPAHALVVDDDANNREFLQYLLHEAGLAVTVASNGTAALESVAERPPDLILLDVKMPGPDGFEVCRLLKSDPATSHIPIVLVTALRGRQKRITGAEAGADEFLSKPFDPVELLARARSLLRSKRYHDQLLAANAELELRVAERTAELRQALEELHRLDQLKSEVMANVSHELRTPLLHAKGYVDLLIDGALGSLTPLQGEGLAVAQEALERLERIVEDVVDFGSLGQEPLTLEAVYLGDVCRHVVQAALPAASRRGVSLNLNLGTNLPHVRADGVALTRILRHLVDNAIKFGRADDAVQLSAALLDGRVRLTVCDRGPGLAPTEMEHIFDALFQVNGSTTRPAGGLGVGLALVKKLVQAHGSAICVKSEPGQGSCFYFELDPA